MNTIFNVIDNESEYGIEIHSFYKKEDAVNKFNKIISDYKEAYGNFDTESEINDTWAEIIFGGDEVARVFWQESILE